MKPYLSTRMISHPNKQDIAYLYIGEVLLRSSADHMTEQKHRTLNKPCYTGIIPSLTTHAVWHLGGTVANWMYIVDWPSR